MSRAQQVGVVALCVLLGGCIPKVDKLGVRDVQTVMPGDFTDPTADGPSQAELEWASFFEDPLLRGLIDEALVNNRELGILLAETRIANAELIARRGEVLPQLGLGAGVGIERVGLYTSQGANDANTDILPGKEVPANLAEFRVGLKASWEIDIWKRLRNATKAARLRYLSSIEGRNFVVTQLVAEVATTYYELLALDNQLKVVQTNIGLLTDSLGVVELQKDAARVTELAVLRFEADLLKNQSLQYRIEQQIVETENRMNLLVGRFPQPVARNAEGFVGLKPQPGGLGSPAQLVENRPDIRAAELELEAAQCDVKAARALFYPALSVDAGVGYEAFALKLLAKTPESLIFDAAASLFAPLFNRSSIKAGYFSAHSRRMQAVLDYERTLQTAYVEVVNQRSNLKNLDQSFSRKAEQVAVLERAIVTSTDLFSSARADYLEVLTTRREALDAQLELIETKQQQLQASVDLYQALGGGWRKAATP